MKSWRVWMVMAMALAGCGEDPNVRSVAFPKIYYELGILYARDAGSSDPKAWVYVRDANGTVKVPRGQELQLCAAQDVKTLEPLRSLAPGDLHTIDLGSSNVADGKLAPLGHLTGLKALDFTLTPITDAGLEHLAGLGELEELVLRQTVVTDAGLEKLKGLKGLKKVDLRGTKVTEAGVAGLRAALSGCEVRVEAKTGEQATATEKAVVGGGE